MVISEIKRHQNVLNKFQIFTADNEKVLRMLPSKTKLKNFKLNFVFNKFHLYLQLCASSQNTESNVDFQNNFPYENAFEQDTNILPSTFDFHQNHKVDYF